MATTDDDGFDGPKGELLRQLGRLEPTAGLTREAVRLLAEQADISYPGFHLPLLSARRSTGHVRFVLQGIVKVVSDVPPFGRVIVDFVGPGEFLCLPPALPMEAAQNVVAVVHQGPVVIALMSRRLVAAAIARLPRPNVVQLTSWSWRAPWRLACARTALLALSTERRLLGELARLAMRFGRPYDERWTRIDIRLRQEDLAALIVRRRSNVSRAFTRLRRQGLLGRVGGHILVATSHVDAHVVRLSTEDAPTAIREERSAS